MNRAGLLAVLLLAGAALLLRWPALDQRPLHNDEAVNAVKFGRLWETGRYLYDPNEHHGPSLYYATFALAKLTGAPRDIVSFSEARLRLVPLVFGAGLILLLPLIADGLGRRGVLWAGVLTLVSPAMAYYSRYYIHEMLLVLFCFLALAASWRYRQRPGLGWALAAGAGIGLMAATKETFVINLGAAAVALVGNALWRVRLDASGPGRAIKWNWAHLAGAVAAGGFIAAILFSSFLTNPAGMVDAVRTYMPWLERAGGETPHVNPWYFFAQRLLWFHPGQGPIWTELAIALLAGVAAVAGFRRKDLAEADPVLLRFLTLYTVSQAVVYSLIPYKTPWCLLSFWHSAILLAGAGAACLVAQCRSALPRLALRAALLAAVCHLGWEAWRLNSDYAADRRNPHVYAHTSRDLLTLVAKLQPLAAAHPDGTNVLIKVICPESDYWPLPWYLRQYRRVGWWDAPPADPFSPIMIVAASLNARFDEKETHLMIGYFELRPGIFLECYVEKKLWEEFLKRNPPPREEGG